MTDATKLGKIFIGGLSYETTDEKLRSYFGAYGTVTDAVVMKDPISRRSRGFGFITYADPSCVDRALAQPNHILDSRRVEAKRAVPRAESMRDIGGGSIINRGTGTNTICSISASSLVGATKKIFVGGLHYETKDADFKKYFTQYGKVVSAEVMFNRETNKSRGFGFVIFESEASVEMVLQEANHVIDGKSVEVKRAVPRTDVPPPRSVSSRGGSFSGLSGPGSVGSLDEISTATTPPVSLCGSVPSSNGLATAMGSEKLSRTSSASANLMPNGMLGGYAAAVRYGGRGVLKSSSSNAMPSSSMTSPRLMPNNEDSCSINGITLDSSAINGVADALSSLVIGNGSFSRGGGILSASSAIPSPPLSAGSSSRGSTDHFMDSATTSVTNGHMSPLDVAFHPLDNDPVIEQWKLSPSLGPQLSPSAPHSSPTKSSFVLHGLVDDTSQHGSNLSWQASPWQQQSWGSPPLPRTQQQQQPPLPPVPTPLFSIFSSQHNEGTRLHGSSAWPLNADTSYDNNDSIAPSGHDSFGNRMMGIDLSIDGGFGHTGSAFGMHSESDTDTPYSSLGNFLQPDYLATNHDQQQLENEGAKHSLDSFGQMVSDDGASDADDLCKNPISVNYDLPSSTAAYHRQYR
ncbi:heterogeneous nuclear ribonucleoprotein [Plasmopara halstedii]|uniref:Heterogeneous nuclear ribonucleoprotein n=1 Tax=Plasmopara halstedii TaxID=4781 RepID=A0A0P1B7E3_PLAHL|nr:heterogeneous nuclear ribonucleoprotein [Plasmopara halstedii]CEG50517.1 heterogeneous nuclear ribonucleoprotein [Plasmopara halstedii]|eukprot:XP_024586886.1 heterogeneous nuclear ribonucleoprotein [Plasmopara halstedii]